MSVTLVVGLWGLVEQGELHARPATQVSLVAEAASAPARSGASPSTSTSTTRNATPVTPDPDATAATAPVSLPAEPPISSRELRTRVSPAVVALIVSSGGSAASVVPGVLVTASGFVLTSREAIAAAIDGNASVAMVRGGSHGRVTARDLTEAVPARLVAVCDELDLAVVEAMPTEVVFYPHLPIARYAVTEGSVALAVGHTRKLGLWSAAMIPIGPRSGRVGPARWLRTLPSEPSPLSPGTPLLDAIGRVVGVVAKPIPNGSRMAVDPEGLLRFLLAARAPDLRFAGVPSFRRPTSVEVAAMDLRRGISKRSDPWTSSRDALPLGGATTRTSSAQPVAPPTRVTSETLPGIAKKGAIDRHFATSSPREPSSDRGAAARHDPTAAPSAWRANALGVTLAALEQQGVPESLQVDTSDAPQRGERNAAVTIVELGDYHAPETRDADATVRALVEGPNAPARLLWKDADRGDGPDYWLPARAARAAAEQGQFWAMHDHLLRVSSPFSLDRVNGAVRDLGLDEDDFSASLSSEGITSAIETDTARAARLPLLCTPSFVVNGRPVDGGSIAALALKAAVDEELWRVPGQSPIAVRSPRGIAGGSPIAGAAFDPEKMARVIADASARRAGRSSAAPAGASSGR